MVIAMSAQLSVAINKFFMTAASVGSDIAAAIRDTMLLFNVEPVGIWPAEAALAELEADSLLLDCLVDSEAENVYVTVTISFRQPQGEPQSLTRRERRPLSQAGSSSGEDYTVLARRLVRLALLVLMRRLPGSNPVPWGILRGVRPGKIVHRLFDQGLAPSELVDRLVAEYGLEPVKAELITGIAAYQRSVISDEQAAVRNKKVSIYIGIPYCPSRCLYCSFPSYVLPERREDLDAFLRAIKRDIENAAQLINNFNLSVESIYMGGGTPTSLPAADLSSLLALIDSEIRNAGTKEFTVEAGRPDSIDQEKIAVLRQYQINRVSINPQTMQDKTLKQIGRRHTAQDIIDTFDKIRHANIPLINMDVIAGLPGETEADMEDTMGQIAAINPDNVTIHTLALKRGSLLKEALTTGMLSGSALPNEEITKQMLMIGQDYMTKMNMHPYYLYRQKYMTGNLENIGYAKPAADCLYNIQIMEERQTIIGIGPAAGTKAVSANPWRLQSSYNAKDVSAYVRNLDTYLNGRNTLLSKLYSDRKEDLLC